MITHPIAKINLGLNIVERRPDGYHNLETIFYPVPLCDALELFPMGNNFPSAVDCDIKITNIHVEGDEQQNLVVKAYQLLKADFPAIPRLHAHLYKGIPTQTGMGGGSSDATYMLMMLNELCSLGLSPSQLAIYARKLGADCAFFLHHKPCYAEGIGDQLTPISLDLQGMHIVIVRPNISVSTKEAYSMVTPQRPLQNCRNIVEQPIENWKKLLVNDFEASVFKIYPEIGHIKEQLYQKGAIYAAMSGSGSAVYGIFRQPANLQKDFPDMFVRCIPL